MPEPQPQYPQRCLSCHVSKPEPKQNLCRVCRKIALDRLERASQQPTEDPQE